MALTRDEAIARAVARGYENAELKVLQRMVYAVQQGGDAPDWERTTLARLQRARQIALDELVGDDDFMIDMQRNVYQSYKVGHAQMFRDIADEVPGIKAATIQQNAAVRKIAADLVDGVQEASRQVLRNVDDVFRRIVGSATLDAAARGISRRDAAMSALDKLADASMQFRDKAGRLWRLPEYAEMATRTSLANAQIAGHEQALDDIGLTLCIVQPGPRSCKICDEWARKVLNRDPNGKTGTVYVTNELTGKNTSVRVDDTLARARDAGFQHPNCRCRLRAFIPGVTKRSTLERPPWDEQGYEAQQRQREIERKLRKAKLRQVTDDSPRAKARVRGLHAELDDHLDRHPALKRQTDRTSIGGRFATPGERRTRKRGQDDQVPFVRDEFEDVLRPKTPKIIVPPVVPKPTVTKPKLTKPVTPKPKPVVKDVVWDDVPKLPKMSSSLVHASNGRANPGEGSGVGDYNNNCHMVVAAMELRARGFDVSARGTGGALGRYDQAIAGDWVDADGKTRPMSPLSDFEGSISRTRMRAYTEDMPEGARGYMAGAWKRGGGHIFSWEKTKDGVIFHEGQVASVDSRTAGGYMALMKPESITVMRVDDLTPADHMLTNIVAPKAEITKLVDDAKGDEVTILEQRKQRLDDYDALTRKMMKRHQDEITEILDIPAPTDAQYRRLMRLRAENGAMMNSLKQADKKRDDIERTLTRLARQRASAG